MPKRKAITIGFLINVLDQTISQKLWSGVHAGAQKHGVNLLCLVGGELESIIGFNAQGNVLYDLVSPESVDGIITWGSTSIHHTGPEGFRDLLKRLDPLPVVNVGLLDYSLNVVSNDYQSMRDVVLHLVEIHGRRCIAFIRGPEGNQEADERYRAYVEVLAEHDIALDPSLVLPGNFLVENGEEAIRLLVDERKADFDAVIASNDNMAIGALNALRERDIYVPGDVSVAGYDDIEEAHVWAPPLTTVRQPLFEMGERAVEVLLAVLDGQDVSDEVPIPGQLMIRQSCGCLSEAVLQAGDLPEIEVSEQGKAAFQAHREMIQNGIMQSLDNPEIKPALVAQIVDGFSNAVWEDAAFGYMATMEKVFHELPANGNALTLRQHMVSALHRHALPYVEADSRVRAVSVLNQARVWIGETATQTHAHQVIQVQRYGQQLREVGQQLISTFDMAALMDILAEVLPELGIPSCYLSLYGKQGPKAKNARLILAYDQQGRVSWDNGERLFPTRQFIPADLLADDRQYSMVVMPLYFREQQLGFGVFEVGPTDGEVYVALQGQVSSALQGAMLLDALENAYADVEKRIEERTAELKQATKEREEAEAARIKLQEEVIQAQKQALKELSTPIIPLLEGIIIMPLIGNIDSLRAQEIMRALLAGISYHRAKVVIIDITGVAMIDTAIASHLHKSIQAARLKGADTIITGISDAVAETVVDLGIDWSAVDTLRDLQTGLLHAIRKLNITLGD
jgi:DNA-binding LacI/PurR family transcriptional regulator/anti-anti-sigma regulatory factor